MAKFRVFTTTTWLQEYQVEAATAEEAAQLILQGACMDDIVAESIDGEYLWDTERIHSVELCEE